MKKLYIIQTLLMLSVLFGCANNQNKQSTAQDSAELIKQSRIMTHTLVSTDTHFTNSIQELLPKGIKRASKEDLNNFKVAKNNDGIKEMIELSAFKTGETSSKDIKAILGQPLGEKYDSNGNYNYSYDGSEHSYISFVFSIKDELKNILVYSNSKGY